MADSSANSSSHSTPMMDVRIIALYPVRISALSGRLGVRFRKRKKGECTLVPCEVHTIDGKSIARSQYPIPEGTPSARYRAQFESARVSVEQRRIVHVVLSAEPDVWRMDPEQIVLSPIFDDGHRLIFEFQRAHILSVTRRGDLETRLVAVHPTLGVVGTKTVHRFNTRLSALANRCVEHLAGAVDLFPAREQSGRTYRVHVPAGEANLSFDSGDKSHCRPVETNRD